MLDQAFKVQIRCPNVIYTLCYVHTNSNKSVDIRYTNMPEYTEHHVIMKVIGYIKEMTSFLPEFVGYI